MSDSLFTVHKVDIPVTNWGETYYLPVFSDVHRFAYNCDVNRWLSFLNYCKKLEQNNPGRVFYLGLGDYDDIASGSERRMIESSHFHDTTTNSLDDYVKKRTSAMCEEMSFMKGRLIGLIEGNHHFKYASGETSTMQMCRELESKYLGGVSIVRIAFEKNKKTTYVDIYAHHTSGSRSGGKRSGSSLNKLEDMADVWNVDICLAGHDHRMNSGFPVRMYLDRNMKVKQKDLLLVRTGSFQKGWMPGEAGYVPTFNGKPNFLGCPIIQLTPTRDRSNKQNNETENVYIKKSLLCGDYC